MGRPAVRGGRRLASGWGYDGLEIACWGDHLDPWRWDDDEYVAGKLALLEKYNLKVCAISNHLKGQAVCDDPIDQRHRDIVSDRVWGDGDPEGVRQRAAEEMKHTARLAREARRRHRRRLHRVEHLEVRRDVPAGAADTIEAGYQDFADRWNPILDVFDEVGVRFAHEVHPCEIAYDYWTTVRTLEAIGHREAFGLNWDPSHFVWQDLDPVGFLWDFRDRIYHVDCKDTKKRLGNGRNGRLARTCRGPTRGAAGTSSPPATATCRGRTPSGCSTRSATPGRSRWSGRTPAWTGWSAPREALEFVRRLAFDPPAASFDAAFSTR